MEGIPEHEGPPRRKIGSSVGGPVLHYESHRSRGRQAMLDRRSRRTSKLERYASEALSLLVDYATGKKI